VDDWVYSPGLPANLVEIESDLFAKVDELREAWMNGGDVSTIPFNDYSTHEKLHLIRGLEGIDTDQMAELDKAFGLTNSTNAEVQCVWYEKAIGSGYSDAYDATGDFLVNVGRRKFLTPLYKAMKENGKLEMAKDIYSKARPNYHAVSKNTMDDLLGWSQ
ncbi:MAG: aminopeptidase, partial [Flavobacteriales bacterium]|nr:aminopeptidase [Flavobacteriales bacterium]